MIQLQKYSGKDSRHTCPNCGRHSFTYYIDESGEYLSKEVGRCDHESSCGYHYTPKDYFRDHPEAKEGRNSFDKPNKVQPQPKLPPKSPDYIPMWMIQRSESINNTFMDYLKKYWSVKELEAVTKMYHLGSTKDRGCIFTQIGVDGFCHTGKVMFYDNDGHRIRGKGDRGDRVDWLHSRLMRQQGKKSDDFYLVQVLFGEHLIPKRREATIAIVEGEKTAVICALTFPDYIWVSTGGENGLTPEKCKSLKGRDVLIYADADATEKWKQKASLLTFCKSIKVSDWAKNEPIGSKRDIADAIMETKTAMQNKPTTIGDVLRWKEELGISNKQLKFFTYDNGSRNH